MLALKGKTKLLGKTSESPLRAKLQDTKEQLDNEKSKQVTVPLTR